MGAGVNEERPWAVLENEWNGDLLDTIDAAVGSTLGDKSLSNLLDEVGAA
mgnify:CR=1 FL=1